MSLKSNKISKILEELDIKEDIPLSSNNFDYKHLLAPDIRLMNKIIEYMDKNNIEEIEDFIGRGRISVIEVISSNKREDIQIIEADKFVESLVEKGLIEDDELNEGLQMFFSITMDNIDKLMIRKIKKWVKDFRTVKFFKYYGTEFREEENVLSDDEESNEVKMMGESMTVLRKESLKKQNTMMMTKKKRTGKI